MLDFRHRAYLRFSRLFPKIIFCFGQQSPEIRKSKFRATTGFTLLEVLVAMAILSITLVALSRSQSQSISVTGESRAMTTLSLLANSKMAEVESRESLVNGNETGDFGKDFSNLAWQIKVADSGVPYLKRIEVTTQDKRGSKGYQLVLYKYNP